MFANHEKTTFHVFSLFTPLFRRFTLSGVVHGEELFEIYRSVSKILNFMASGSVSENLSKIYRKSIENLNTEPDAMKLRIFDTDR